jgi:hypothetical protein
MMIFCKVKNVERYKLYSYVVPQILAEGCKARPLFKKNVNNMLVQIFN